MNPSATCSEARPQQNERRWRHLVWLLYSIYIFIVPNPPTRWQGWLAAGALFACLLGLYLVFVFSRSLRTKQLLCAAMALLALGVYPFMPAAGVIFIYVASLVPIVMGSAPLIITMIALTAAAGALEGWLLHYSPWIWALISFLSIPAGLASFFAMDRLRSEARLRRAQEQVEHLAQVAERERIARDLHDVLGHTLSLIVLKSELAGRVLPADPGRAQREIAEVEQTARRALAEVRETVRGYRSEGLAVELARARQTLALAGVTLEHETPLPRLAPLVESTLSLVLRECVTNIVRHARAARCRLTIAADPERTLFEITDDGRGGIEHEGNGLRGMRERLAPLGGRLAIDSDRGTRLRVEIPASAPLAQGSGA